MMPAPAACSRPSTCPISCTRALSRSRRPSAALPVLAVSTTPLPWNSLSAPGVGSTNQPLPAAVLSTAITPPARVSARAVPARSSRTKVREVKGS